MTLDLVALTGATVILRRGLAALFCFCSPTKPGTLSRVNVQQITGQEEHSSYAQHVWQGLLKGVAGIQETFHGHKKPEGLGGERYPVSFTADAAGPLLPGTEVAEWNTSWGLH